MIYFYEKPISPDLDYFETLIRVSSIANTYIYLNWNKDDQKLRVNFNVELTVEQKNILDNIINNSPSNPPEKVIFNINDFLFGLMGAFTPLLNYSDILVFYPMIADFARAENFEGMNTFLRGLIQCSVMTEEQFNLINSVLLQQNIDLNNL